MALFFMLTAAALWVKYLLAGEATLRFAWPAMLELLVAGSMAAAMPCGTSGCSEAT